ncbi:MAG: efflux RND transporter periplasmic adaptor subunit [Acidiferrobacterales bacterium]|jgi:membrane fusion protein (multidrug efflux system)|nr:efflux RND transporter periplasmic adaptor subunit [Acidiferrobacterales bacterium]
MKAAVKPVRTVSTLRAGTLVLALLAIASLSSCGDDGNAKSKRAGKAQLVELAEVQFAPVQYAADRAGSLRAVRQVKLFNQEEGQLASVLVRQGDHVKRGQILARLDARLLQAQLDKAIANRKQAEFELERTKKLAPKKLISENALLQVQTKLEISKADESVLRTRLDYMTIRAPFNGDIAERLVEPGDVVSKHTHMLTIVDSSKLVTDVQVSELLVSRLNIGDRADVSIDALGGTVYPGKILRIYPTIDPATRLGRIEVLLDPVPQGARDGHFCRVTLYSSGTRPLVVPSVSVRRDEIGEFVFVADENGKAKRVPVVSGLRFARNVEIQSGLEEKQKVVSKGFLGLVNGQPIKVVNGQPENTPEKVDETPKDKKSTPNA